MEVFRRFNILISANTCAFGVFDIQHCLIEIVKIYHYLNHEDMNSGNAMALQDLVTHYIY